MCFIFTVLLLLFLLLYYFCINDILDCNIIVEYSELLIYKLHSVNYLLKVRCLQMVLTFIINLSVTAEFPVAVEAYK
jgi:hypothetical protein